MKLCHVKRFMKFAFKKRPELVLGAFNEFELDDFAVRELGPEESSKNYKQIVSTIEEFQRNGILVYGHVTPGGTPVMDINDIHEAICLTLAEAYAEEHR